MFLKRMLYVSASIVMLAPAYHLKASSANASTIIYSTFNPGDTYDVTSGWTIGGTSVLVQALQFTPTESGMVQTIEIAAFRLSGGTAVDVSLMTDAGDQPGSVLETVPVCCFGDVPSIQSANSVLHPNLSAGTKYWLVVSPVAAGDLFGSDRLLDPPYALNAQQPMGAAWHVYGLDYRGTLRIRATSVRTVSLDIDPSVINLASRAPFVTAYIEPSGFDPSSIDVHTLRLAGSVPAESKPVTIGDHNKNGVPDLMVKFRRDALDPLLALGVNQLEVTGSVLTGEEFKGTDAVRVIDPLGKPLLASVSPNPFNPSGVLSFSTVKPGRVQVNVFDLQGRLVRRLLEAPHLPAGDHKVTMDGRASWGEVLPSGVYFYRVDSPDGTITGRLTILK